MENTLTYILIYVVVCIIIFLITREFWCWYFKINKTTQLLEGILQELKKINRQNSYREEDAYSANTIKINKNQETTKKETSEDKVKEENTNPNEPENNSGADRT